MTQDNPVGSVKAVLQTRWLALSAREQLTLRWLGWVLGALLFWGIAIAPAWHTLNQSQDHRNEAIQQTERMQALMHQAQALQERPTLSREEALRTLQSLSSAAGAGMQISLKGEQVFVQLKAVRAQALAQWLSLARTQAQALPMEVHLTRPVPGSPGNPATAGPTGPMGAMPPPAVRPNIGAAPSVATTWDGSLLLKLPAASR